MELVEVKKGAVFCDSHMVARKFGQKHAEVVKRIKRLESDLAELRVVSDYPKTITEDREYRGTKYTSYLMNREFFSLLVMRFRGKKALEWQVKFNDAFYQMEKRLLFADSNATDPTFLKTRKQGKIARLQETDIIKDFVEYATKQGSKSAKFYYKHITNSCYRALGLLVQSRPKLRDTMDIMELAELQLMEHRAGLLLKKYMKLGRNYKDIYTSVKEDLVTFGSELRIE